MEAVSTAMIGVEDLDDSALLGAASEAERLDRTVQRRKLEIAYEWCVRHPATSESGAATWGDAGLPGLSDCDASLGGDGTPSVAAFVAEELGAAMGVSTQSAMSLMADALDLRHRFPLLWAEVETGTVAPYKTRRVADDTCSLPFEAARWVDEELAARVNGFGIPTIQRLVALAAARFAPEEQAEKENAAQSQWHVTLSHPRAGEFAGTSWLEAAGDTADLTAFHRLVCDVAKRLGRLGDTDDFETRKAKALGIIAGRQPTLHPADEAPDAPTWPRTTGADPPLRPRVPGRPRHPPGRRPGRRRGREARPRHPRPHPLLAPGLQGHHPAGARPQQVRRGRPARPATSDARTGHPARPALRVPVVRPRRPALGPRPHHPVCPTRRGRTTGQTNPQNLAPLCRRHHRAKTFTGWTYERARDGT